MIVLCHTEEFRVCAERPRPKITSDSFTDLKKKRTDDRWQTAAADKKTSVFTGWMTEWEHLDSTLSDVSEGPAEDSETLFWFRVEPGPGPVTDTQTYRRVDEENLLLGFQRWFKKTAQDDVMINLFLFLRSSSCWPSNGRVPEHRGVSGGGGRRRIWWRLLPLPAGEVGHAVLFAQVLLWPLTSFYLSTENSLLFNHLHHGGVATEPGHLVMKNNSSSAHRSCTSARAPVRRFSE